MKYVSVRWTPLFLEESLCRGLKWVVLEPNEEPLCAQIRLHIGAFLQSPFRNSTFQSKTPWDVYFVMCDRETTTQSDINQGILDLLVGFVPLKPAEFVIFKIQHKACHTSIVIMALPSVNTQQLVPYKNFKFRIQWNGHYLIWFKQV